MTDIVRILTFNIHGGYSLDGKRDLSRVHDLLEDMQIDIAVFQELETRPSRGGTATDINELAGAARPYHLPGPSLKEGRGWYGNLLISRWPVERAVVHDLDTSQDLEPRNAVDATIESPLGRIRVIGTHLSLAPWERPEEVRNLIKLASIVEEEGPEPLLLMGDMNEWKWSSRLLRRMSRLLPLVNCGPTFPSLFPVFKLDRIWAQTEALEVTARTLADHHVRFLSDHLPVYIEIKKRSNEDH